MDVVIRLGVRIEMHWSLFSIGTLKLNTSPCFFTGCTCYFTTDGIIEKLNT